MKLATISLLALALTTFLGCVTTSVSGRRVAGQEDVRFSGIFVYMEAEETVRNQVERDLSAALVEGGLPAETSLVFMSEPRAYTPEEISQIMDRNGLDGFLRVRLENYYTEGRETHYPGGVFMGHGFLIARSPHVHYSERTRLTLRLDLFDHPMGPLVWSGHGRARAAGRPSLRRLARKLGVRIARRFRKQELVAPTGI